MESIKVKGSTKLLVAATFVLMIVVNGLANALPINGLNTGEISDAYPNLFAPAGITFSIWGLIYILLAIYTLYQADVFQGKKSEGTRYLLNKIGVIFSLSSLANAAWIFSWHYQIMPLSLFLMFVILLSLIIINRTIDAEKLSSQEKFLIRLPFSIYFGWITVASIANATAFLVSVGWGGFGLAESTWTMILLVVGTIIGGVTMIKSKNLAYGCVLIWAYFGIWIKHTSESGFAAQYSAVIATVLLCIALLTAMGLYLIYMERKNNRTESR